MLIYSSDCIPPIIKLIPEENSLLNLYQYNRSQDFYILSTIKLNCNNSLSAIKKWTIRNNTMNNYSEINFDKRVLRTLSELYIPSNTLLYGIYQLKLTVTMTEYPNLTNSASVYVQINPLSHWEHLFSQVVINKILFLIQERIQYKCKFYI